MRTPRRGAAMTARVSLRARRHRLLGSGGGGTDGGVSADCVAEALLLRGLVLLASRARQLVRLRASAAAASTSCLARPQLRGRESRLSKRCFAWHDRLAQGCQSLFARAGLPWHAEPISALPVALVPG